MVLQKIVKADLTINLQVSNEDVASGTGGARNNIVFGKFSCYAPIIYILRYFEKIESSPLEECHNILFTRLSAK